MTRPSVVLALVALTAAAAEPPSIASFSPAATRILVDLGRADRIAAATRWCELPAGAEAPRLCDAFEPELERLLARRPDAVVVPRLANPLLADRLRAAGLRVVVLAPESPESPAADIRALGELALATAQAEALLAARRSLRPPNGRRVLIIWDNVCAGPDSYLSWVIRAAGAEPAPAKGTWPEWNPEEAALTNPDLVLYLDPSAPSLPQISRARLNEWRTRPGLRATKCATRGYIFEARPGTRWLPASGLPEAASNLARLMEENK